MPKKLQIELEDEVFYQLNDLCKGDESIIKYYIVQTLKEKINQSNENFSSGENDSLEGYLKKGQSGRRNYGVNGQGW